MEVLKKSKKTFDKLIDTIELDLFNYLNKYISKNDDLYCVQLHYNFNYQEYHYFEYEYKDFWEVFEYKNAIEMFHDEKIKNAYLQKIDYDDIILSVLNDRPSMFHDIIRNGYKYRKELQDVHPELFNDLVYEFNIQPYSSIFNRITFVRGMGLI